MKREARALALGIAALLLGLAVSNAAYAQDTAATPPQEVVAPDTTATQQAPDVAPPDTPATPPPPSVVGTPADGKGLVVFFRPSRGLGAALTFTVRENDETLGRLWNARYFVHEAEPGIHEYNVGRNDTLRMEVEPGETYYVQQNIGMGLITWSASFEPSNQAAFEAALPRMRRWVPRD